ncbi:hypothetical protein E2320_014366, partial [Naja naja]
MLRNSDKKSISHIIGHRIQETAAYCWEYKNSSNATTKVGIYPHCNQTFEFNSTTITHYLNSTLTGNLTIHTHNFTKAACTFQLTGCNVGIHSNGSSKCPTTANTGGLNLCNIIEVLIQQTQSSENKSTNMIGTVWMLCRRKAYSHIPPCWSGRCTLGYIAPSIIISKDLPKGRLRNRREVQSPILICGTVVFTLICCCIQCLPNLLAQCLSLNIRHKHPTRPEI